MKTLYVRLASNCTGNHSEHELTDGIWNSFYANSNLYKSDCFPEDSEIEAAEKELEETGSARIGDYEFYYKDEE